MRITTKARRLQCELYLLEHQADGRNNIPHTAWLLVLFPGAESVCSDEANNRSITGADPISKKKKLIQSQLGTHHEGGIQVASRANGVLTIVRRAITNCMLVAHDIQTMMDGS